MIHQLNQQLMIVKVRFTIKEKKKDSKNNNKDKANIKDKDNYIGLLINTIDNLFAKGEVNNNDLKYRIKTNYRDNDNNIGRGYSSLRNRKNMNFNDKPYQDNNYMNNKSYKNLENRDSNYYNNDIN